MLCALNQNGSFQTQEELNAKWTKDVITYSIKKGTGDFDQLQLALNLAMTTWDIEIPIKLKRVKEKGDITLEFSTTDKYFTDSPGVLAYAYFPEGPNQGKIVFNDAYLWSIDGQSITGAEYMRRTGRQVSDPTNFFSTYNITHTLIHEIGHSLGLVHSGFKTDVMYPFYNKVTTLTDNDILRITSKYGKSSPPKRLKEWLKRKIK